MKRVSENCQKHHYANMSEQNTAIFQVCRNDNFQIIFFLIFFLFLLITDIEGTFGSGELTRDTMQIV